ncbi:MAG: type II toxin-antitoxin system VapC family toxin [Chloroflexi bacterium]|nr:type II toxin-antitoxin system VapC family toxin [Chloroflexota bacterium]
MVCSDTTFLADLIRKNPDAIKKLTDLAKEGKSLSTTIITSAELFYGAYKSNNVDREKAKMRLVLSRFIVFQMDEISAEKFGQILSGLEKLGLKIADKDVMIAATALSKGENTIITRNKRDFERIPNITVETY